MNKEELDKAAENYKRTVENYANAVDNYIKESSATLQKIGRIVDANIERIKRIKRIEHKRTIKNTYAIFFLAGFALARIYFGV